jgi:hypothetical protein
VAAGRSRPSNCPELSRQRVKLVGKRHRLAVLDRELILSDHVHELDAGQHVSGRIKGFEVEHRPGHPLDGPMVLLDDVVEIFDLTHHNWRVFAGIDGIDGRLVGAALVRGDLVGSAVLAHGLVEEAFGGGHVPLCGQEEIDCFPMHLSAQARRVHFE